MNNLVTVLVLALIGGVIGWITNILAIKLMFRPINPIRIPLINYEILGLIPKRKMEIAQNIGEVVSNELLSIDDLLDQAFQGDGQEDFSQIAVNKIKEVVSEKINFIPGPFRMMIAPYVDELVDKEAFKVIEDVKGDVISGIKDRVDIQKMVEEKINELDLLELERIIISVAKKELKHIEILGFVLGGVIGLIQGAIVILL